MNLRLVVVVLGALWAGLGCQRTPEPRPPGFRATVTPFVPPVPTPRPNTRSRLLADPELAEIDAVLDVAVQRGTNFARDIAEESMDQLVRVEWFFVSLGRMGQLLDLYRQRVEADGPASPFAPRLAVLYTELGYRAEARALLDAALEAQPESVVAHAAAALWLLQGRSPTEAERVEAARHLLAVRDAPTPFPGIFERDARWVEGTLRQFTEAQIAAARGQLTGLAAQRIDRALSAARAASPDD